MKRNILAGASILLFSLCSISCDDKTNDNAETEMSDTMTMPAGLPADTITNSAPPAVVDTSRRTDSMPSR